MQMPTNANSNVNAMPTNVNVYTKQRQRQGKVHVEWRQHAAEQVAATPAAPSTLTPQEANAHILPSTSAPDAAKGKGGTNAEPKKKQGNQLKDKKQGNEQRKKKQGNELNKKAPR